jgi:iron complex transport system substrate-binding protein
MAKLIKLWMDKPSKEGTKIMNSKNLTYVAAVIIVAIVLSATFVYVNMNQANSVNTKENITVVDDEGYALNMTSYPQRIISLAPSNTQILFAIGAGDKVVGVTDYDNYPYNFSAWITAGNMTSIGGYSTPNKETIASLQPDLILATPINDVDVVTLRSLGYSVLVINPASINGVLHDIALIGNATGNQAGATSLADKINSQINSITSKIAAANIQEKPKVYYEIWDDPLMSAGGTTWINDIINKVGAINIFANETQQYPTVSSESIVQMNPDVILLPSSMGTGTITPDSVKARSGWNTINAVKNNRIVVIDGDLFAEAGSRIGEQVSAIAQAIYPDLFNSP